MRVALYLCLGLMGMVAFSDPTYNLFVHVIDHLTLECNTNLWATITGAITRTFNKYTTSELIIVFMGPLCFVLSLIWAILTFLVPLLAKLKLLLAVLFLGTLCLISASEMASPSVLGGALLGFSTIVCLVLVRRVRMVGQLQRLLRAYYLPQAMPRVRAHNKPLEQDDLVPASEPADAIDQSALSEHHNSELSLRRSRVLGAMKRLSWSAVNRPICCNLWGYTIALTDLPYLVRALNQATQGNLSLLKNLHQSCCAYENAAHQGQYTAQMQRFLRSHLTQDSALALKVNLRIVCELLLEHIPTMLELFAAERSGNWASLNEDSRAFSTEAVLQAWLTDHNDRHYLGAYTPQPGRVHTCKAQLSAQEQHIQALRVALYHELSLNLAAGQNGNPPSSSPNVQKSLTDYELLELSFDVTPKSVLLKRQPQAQEMAGLPNAMLTAKPMGRMRTLGLVRLLTPIGELMACLAVLWGMLQSSTLCALLELQANHYISDYAQALGKSVNKLLVTPDADMAAFISHNAVMGLTSKLSNLPLTVYSSALLSGYNLWLLCLLLTLALSAIILLSGLGSAVRILLKRVSAGLEFWHTLHFIQIYVVCTALFALIAVAFTYQTKLPQLWYDVHSDLNLITSKLNDKFELQKPHDELLTIDGIINRNAGEYSLGPNNDIKTLRRLALYTFTSDHRWVNVYAPLHSSFVAAILADIRQEQDRRFTNERAPHKLRSSRRAINASIMPYRLTVTPRLHFVVALEPLAVN